MSVNISTYLIYPTLDELEISKISGALVNNLFIDIPIPQNKYADITYSKEIKLNLKPEKQIIKMTKQEYVDEFFETGAIQLGCFNTYKNATNLQVKDELEGSFILVGTDIKNTYFLELAGGFNYYVFCTSLGEYDSACAEKFEYNSGYVITNPHSFALEIQKKLNAKSYNFAECKYAKDKVILEKIEKTYNPNELSAKSINMIKQGKYFIKPQKYLQQKEFRFIWEVNKDINDYKKIYCPESIKYCKRLE